MEAVVAASVHASDAASVDRQFVTALARGLDILGCFSASRPSITVTELAGLLSLPQPTVWRLCHTLASLGYIAMTEDGRLRPALAVLRLGYAILSEMPATELARPHLQALADRYRGAAGVAVRDGNDMRFVERCESDSQLVLNLRVGSRLPVATSAMGWAYLAALPDAERAAAAGGPAIWRAAEAAFRRALPGYEEHGFIINPGVLHPGYHTAAVAVTGGDGRPAFTLNCGGAASVLPVALLHAEVGPKLRSLAATLAAAA
jgi:DNA-binding IclR family transcriptional regulator